MACAQGAQAVGVGAMGQAEAYAARERLVQEHELRFAGGPKCNLNALRGSAPSLQDLLEALEEPRLGLVGVVEAHALEPGGHELLL